MKRYSFSTFEVDDSNRGAFEICRAVSELQSVSPQPVVLLGDDGCGKTHLLYAIVNHVRASSARAGLAYVTAREFPKEVRSLAIDPSPVEKASSAILLVDQLDKFSELTEELEAIVRVFLDNHHCVVVASAVHPERLKNLTEGLRNLLTGGLIVGIRPRVLAGTSGGLSDAEFRFHSERKQLLGRVEKAEQEAGAAQKAIVELRARADVSQAKAERSVAELETAKQSMEALKAALDRYRSENENLKRRLDELSTQSTAIENLQAGHESLETELQETRAERDAAERDRDLLAVKLEEYADLQTQIKELTDRAEGVRIQRENEDRELAAFFDRLEAMIERTVSVRTAFRQREENVRDRIANIVELLSQVAVLDGGRAETKAAEERAVEAEQQLAQARQELEDAKARFEYEVASATNEARQQTAAREKAVEKLDQLTATCAALEIELDELREKAKSQTDEIDSLRREAAEQAAKVSTQTEELDALRRGAAEQAARISAQTEEMDVLRREADEQAARISAQAEEMDALRKETAEQAAKVAAQAEELDALRKEAAEQVAEAMAQAGEVERKYSSLLAVTDQIRQAGQVVGAGLDSLRRQLSETAESMSALGQRLTDAIETDVDAETVSSPSESGGETAELVELADRIDVGETGGKRENGDVTTRDFDAVAGNGDAVHGDENGDGDLVEAEHAFVENLNQTVK